MRKNSKNLCVCAAGLERSQILAEAFISQGYEATAMGVNDLLNLGKDIAVIYNSFLVTLINDPGYTQKYKNKFQEAEDLLIKLNMAYQNIDTNAVLIEANSNTRTCIRRLSPFRY